MKKIIVENSNLDEQTTIDIELELTSHFMYGLYEFNPERLIEDISRKYKLKLISITHPFYNLINDFDKSLTLKFVEEHY